MEATKRTFLGWNAPFIHKINRWYRLRYVQLGTVLVLLLPLFFINVIDYHDWGGDFAGYIQQGINIAQFEPHHQTHYVFNPEYPFLAPPSYTVGFPLLLAPVYGLFGNHIIAYSIFLTIIIVGIMLAVFYFLKQYFSFSVALTGVLVFAYNPWILRFKGEILADLPFTFFLIASVWLYERSKKTNNRKLLALIVGFLIGYSMLIKGLGIIVLGAMVLDVLVEHLRSKEGKEWKHQLLLQRLKLLGFSTATCLGTYVLLGVLLFPAKQESFLFFYTLFQFGALKDILLKNADYYIKMFEHFFHPDAGQWRFAPLITRAFALTFVLLGLFLNLFKKPGVKEFVAVGYLLVILSFPDSTQGFRYLLPVFPLALYYMIDGLRSVKVGFKLNRLVVLLCLLVVIGLQYKRDINKVLDQKVILQGPQSSEAKEAWAFIAANTATDARIVFRKPRVLGLFAGRDSYTVNPAADAVATERQLQTLGFDYVLVCSDFGGGPVEGYVEQNAGRLKKVFENGKFVLWEKR